MEALLGFVTPVDALKEFHDITGRPILISEFHFRAWDSGLPNRKPSPLLFPVAAYPEGPGQLFRGRSPLVHREAVLGGLSLVRLFGPA